MRTCNCTGLCQPDQQHKDAVCNLNAQVDAMRVWVIICIDRTQQSDDLVFWRPDSKGYTTCLERAGLYDTHEMKRHTRHGHHIPVLKSRLDDSEYKRTAVDRNAIDFQSEIKKAEAREKELN